MINTLIKKFSNSKKSVRAKRLEDIKDLPADQITKQLGRLLFDICVENALSFVTEEFSKDGSLFRRLHKHKLFHEMLAINFWLVDKKFSKTSKSIISEIHNLYNIAYGSSGEYFIAGDLLGHKYRTYHASWNDFTGHQDQFGVKASEFIFEPAADIAYEQTSFWIISHAHDAIESLSHTKKTCRNLGIEI